MNKVKFDAQVLDLYSEDYEYMQDSAEEEVDKIGRCLFNPLYQTSIIRGFNLAIDPSDTTKVIVYHTGGVGYLVTSSGLIGESLTSTGDISVSDYTLGTVNYVYAVYSKTNASYDLKTQTIEEGVQKAIDFSNNTLVYNRYLDTWTIHVYTLLEISLLTSTGNMVLLGTVEANGAGNPLSNLDITGRVYASMYLPAGSVTVDSLIAGFLLPQTNVEESLTIDDRYAGVPANLEDDLNKIRTKLREIQGTFYWDDVAPGSLINFDAMVNALHANGVFSYGSVFDATILTSSGTTYVKLDSGKALASGAMVVIPTGTFEYLTLTNTDDQFVGNWAAKTGYESHNLIGLPQGTSFQLTKATLNATILAASLHITDTTDSEYTIGVDYTYDSSTGYVTTVIGGNIINEIIYCYYEYGFPRYDTVEAKSNAAFATVVGTAQNNPNVPEVTAGATRIFNIERVPFTTTSTGNIVYSDIQVPKVRDRIEILPINYITSPYSTNYFTYHKSTDVVDSPLAAWSLGLDGTKYYATTATQNSYISTSIYVQEGDELWIRASKNNYSGTITVWYESVPGSVTLDKSVTFDLYSLADADDLLLFVANNLLEGQHQVKIVVNDVLPPAVAGSAIPYKIYGVVYGKLSMVYTKDFAYFENVFADVIKPGVISFDDDNTLYRTSAGILATNNNFSADQLISYSAPTNNIMVGNKEYNDSRYANRDDVYHRLELAERKNLEQDIQLAFLEQRPTKTTQEVTELFANEDLIDPDYDSPITYSVDVPDNTDWNDNWKESTTTRGAAFKNGYMRPRKYFYMMEPRDYYNLDGIGQSGKGAISRYDVINNCYWLLTGAGANAAGEIVMVGPHFKNNALEVLGSWFLPAMGANRWFIGIDVDTTGANLYLTLRGDHASAPALGLRPNTLFKIPINNTSTAIGARLGLSNAPMGQTLAMDTGTVGTGSKVKSCVMNTTITVTTAAGTADLRVGMALWSATAFTMETYVTAITSSTTFTVSAAAGGSVTENVTFSDASARFLEFSSVNNLFADCTIWDATSTDIGYIYTTAAAGANRTFTVQFRQTAEDASWPKNLQVSALSAITMNPYLINGTNEYVRSMHKDITNNVLWLKLNDSTQNTRFIYNINLTTDVVSDVMLSHSGRYRTIRSVAENWNSGITLAKDNELLEVVSTAANGNFIAKRAIKNALLAENQVSGSYRMNAITGASQNPNLPVACMVESSRYYWTGEINRTLNTCNIYRFDPVTGNYKGAKLTGAGWTYIYDMTTDGTTLWLLGFDGTNYDIYYGDLATFVTAMGADNPATYPFTTAIDITAWGTLVALGAVRTNVKRGICYSSENTIVYVINNTANQINTLDGAGTYTPAVYNLVAPTNLWVGIATKNGKIFVRDWTNTSTPNRIHVMDIALSSATAWYRFHVYQDPAESFISSGSACFDFNGNDFVSVHQTYLQFYKVRNLEDPLTLQVHSFFLRSDNGGATLNPYSILLSNNIRGNPEIATRYFSPEQYSDLRDVPDKAYAAVTYTDEGLTLLHFDEYFGDQSASGVPRYDVRKVRVQHYKKGGVAIGSANVIFSTGTAVTTSATIRHDMIFYGMAGTTSYFPAGMIDLKGGKAYGFTTAANVSSGFVYQGTLSQRNDGMGYGGTYNLELNLTYAIINSMASFTFMKGDSSEFNQQNPKTYVSMCTFDGGVNYANDLLVIDWDANGNRTPSKVWKTISATTNTAFASYIAPSGYLFAGGFSTVGPLYIITNDGASGSGSTANKTFAWQIAKDSSGSAQVGSNILGGYAFQISPNSRCWKTTAGSWRHILLCGTVSDSIGGGTPKMVFVDVENATTEVVISNAGNPWYFSVDNYEDFVVTQIYNGVTGYTPGLGIYRKQRFLDKVSTTLFNGWSPKSLDYVLTPNDRPVFYFPSAAVTTPAYPKARIMRYFNIISSTSYFGMQFIHSAWNDNSLYQTTVFEVDNPKEIHYIEDWAVE